MSTKRRLNIASRQLALAKIARREAMTALAEALSEEQRSTFLTERSHALLREYQSRLNTSDGASLRDHAVFARSLQDVADQAERSRRDASDQSAWQAQTLAAAENRANRLSELLDDARREDQAAKTARETSALSAMARKLHRRSSGAGGS